MCLNNIKKKYLTAKIFYSLLLNTYYNHGLILWIFYCLVNDYVLATFKLDDITTTYLPICHYF